jgi:hypothetical protein
MPTLEDRIAEIASFDHGYEDPELWSRLEPKLHEEIVRAIRAIVGTGVLDFADYRSRLGYLRGLQWTMNEAERLLRRELGREATEQEGNR